MSLHSAPPTRRRPEPPALPGSLPRRRLALVRALVAAEPALLAAWLDRETLEMALARWLEAQGLAAYTFHQLRAAGLIDRVAAPVQHSLHDQYRQSAMCAVVHQQHVAEMVATLAAAGVEAVLIKGVALATTVYPAPWCRAQSDIDLWVQPEQLPAAVTALTALGYRAAAKEDRPLPLQLLIGGEQKMADGRWGGAMVELQWPPIRGEWVRYTTTVDHAAIWARRRMVQIKEQPVATMAPEDVLIHLCIHLAINHHFGVFWLRALLDIHLLAQAQPLDWAAIAERARLWRVATAVWVVLDLAHRLLGTPLPADLVETLAPTRARQWAIQRLHLDRAMVEMRPGGYYHWRFLVQLLLVDHLPDVGRLVGRSLVPEARWIQARYGVGAGHDLWRARLAHPLRLLLTARA